MKLIKIRNTETKKVIHQFYVHDAEITLAKKLGLNLNDYIIEKGKVELDERKANEPNND
jgi:hypothetical protein